MAVKVTDDIFRSASTPPGFSPIPYMINIAHPVMAMLYDRFHEIYKLPKHYPLSDKQRFAFEKWILDLVKEGKIIVEEYE